MAYSNDQLTDIYERTDGHCHICTKKLSRKNYAQFGERGAWEVEHSRARALGGTDAPSNRYAACIRCNRSKGCGSTRSARARNGRRCAPLSKVRRAEERTTNAVLVGGAGAVLGHQVARVLGWHPAVGTIAGGLLGADAGHRHNPDRRR